MKKNYVPLTFLLLFLLNTAYSQGLNYSSFLIPDSLKTNATSVVRENLLEITIKSVDKQVIKKRKVVTVLNENGKDSISLYEHYNDDTKINKLSIKIYNALGAQIKKYSKGKFTDISAVDGGTLYSDAKVKYVDYTPTAYPYTVVFESETTNSSTGFIPQWYPIYNYSTSVQKSIYKVNNPLGLEIRIKERNLEDYSVTNLSTENTIHYELVNSKAKKYERSSIAFIEIMPSVLIALNEFALKGVKGSATNWKEFGKWRYDFLFNGKDNLSQEIKLRVKELVNGIDSDIEKAKVIYNYMQNRTRYISVQEGIGGWKPIPANQVDKVGYGDCKGLTNYTKALLDAVGVKSHYSIVWAGEDKKSVEKDFFSMQGNHVILNIPNNGDDIWLECTSQIMPFGFLGDFTDDRDVLVVTPEGGIIKRTPAYKNEFNLQTTKATVQLDKNGNINADFERESKGTQYDDKFYIEQKSNDDLKKYYKSDVWDYNNNLDITAIELKNDKDVVSFSEKVKVSITDYATITDTEYIFRPNFFNKFSYIPKRYRNRTLPLKISRGFVDKDAYTIKIPEGYKAMPNPMEKELKTKFGVYKISLEKIDESTLLYKKHFSLNEGLYPKEDYKKYRKFLKSVAKLENSRVAISKI